MNGAGMNKAALNGNLEFDNIKKTILYFST